MTDALLNWPTAFVLALAMLLCWSVATRVISDHYRTKRAKYAGDYEDELYEGDDPVTVDVEED